VEDQQRRRPPAIHLQFLNIDHRAVRDPAGAIKPRPALSFQFIGGFRFSAQEKVGRGGSRGAAQNHSIDTKRHHDLRVAVCVRCTISIRP